MLGLHWEGLEDSVGSVDLLTTPVSWAPTQVKGGALVGGWLSVLEPLICRDLSTPGVEELGGARVL